MTTLVLLIVIFLAAGLTLLAANLILGKLVRPERPNAEKGEPYECGEEPVGPAWVQFDLRFYVVALLFVIFDVELAFFFPWAVVFGSANRAADVSKPDEKRVEAALNLRPQLPPVDPEAARLVKQLQSADAAQREAAAEELRKLGAKAEGALEAAQRDGSQDTQKRIAALLAAIRPPPNAEAAHDLAWLAFGDIMVFFAVLLVGFAYLWRRGDLEWVRSTAAQEPQPPPASTPPASS